MLHDSILFRENCTMCCASQPHFSDWTASTPVLLQRKNEDDIWFNDIISHATPRQSKRCHSAYSRFFITTSLLHIYRHRNPRSIYSGERARGPVRGLKPLTLPSPAPKSPQPYNKRLYDPLTVHVMVQLMAECATRVGCSHWLALVAFIAFTGCLSLQYLEVLCLQIAAIVFDIRDQSICLPSPFLELFYALIEQFLSRCTVHRLFRCAIVAVW